ncbi:preprotein translocase subunit SecY [Candidatus Cyanaurora vandensis]|uniref:preprotein translocase subunit SecY n=1 Tax=Candidatus Cyanaurora vandensis TaxID=2714958 RepID=UPI00257D1DEA|nr:preprotein translocase subunit SecY [Candidatus Cyanaurora vandensis]
MTVSPKGPGSPSTQQLFSQLAQSSNLRNRILFTIGLLILARLGIFIPLPGIDQEGFLQSIQNNQLISFLDVFTGRGLSSLGVFALGILPYINASIITQLLVPVFPKLEALQKDEGEQGRRQIAQYTRFLALGWAIIQGLALAFYVRPFAAGWDVFFVIQTTLALVAGAIFIMWVGELLTEKGIGNGASLLIFVSIASSLPSVIGNTIALVQKDNSLILGAIVLSLVFVGMIVAIVFVQEGTRRIPILSAKRQVGPRGTMSQQGTSYLPLRVNQGGVMPIIFASSLLVLPYTIAQFANSPAVSAFISTYLNPTSFLYTLLYLVLILFFSYFYATLIINPEDLAKNLKRMGSSIPGVRPGKATADYVAKIIGRLTLIGAVFLGIVAVVPTAIEQATRVTTFNGLGATSLLILVGVAIDTAKQVQTYMISQRYEGMVKRK